MATLKKVKGTVLLKNVQDNQWGVLKTRQDKKDVTLRFLSSGLDKNINVGTSVSGVLIKQHCDGVNIDVVVNLTKVPGKKAKNLKMVKSGGKKKKGHVTSVNPLTQSRIILGDDGNQYIDYGTNFIPVGAAVDFTDSGIVDPASGLLIATNVTLA